MIKSSHFLTALWIFRNMSLIPYIGCLSDSTYTVFATSSTRGFVYLSSVCRLDQTVNVPVQWPFYDQILSSDLSDNLRLSWDWPSCGKCQSHGGRCGLTSNSSLEIACSSSPSKGTFHWIFCVSINHFCNICGVFYMELDLMIIYLILFRFYHISWKTSSDFV